MSISNEEMYAGLLFSKTLLNNVEELEKAIRKLREDDPERVTIIFGYYIGFVNGMIQMMVNERKEFKDYFKEVANILRKY